MKKNIPVVSKQDTGGLTLENAWGNQDVNVWKHDAARKKKLPKYR